MAFCRGNPVFGFLKRRKEFFTLEEPCHIFPIGFSQSSFEYAIMSVLNDFGAGILQLTLSKQRNTPLLH